MKKRSALYDFHNYTGDVKSTSYRSELNAVYVCLLSIFLATSVTLYMTEHYQSLVNDGTIIHDDETDRFSGSYAVLILTTSIVMGIMTAVTLVMIWHNSTKYNTKRDGDDRTLWVTVGALCLGLTASIFNIVFIEHTSKEDVVVEKKRLRGNRGNTLLGLNGASVGTAGVASILLYFHNIFSDKAYNLEKDIQYYL